jgi:hypothetical protein
LIFGDFNGDRKTDIIRQEYNGWINGVNDTQFVSFQNGNFQVVGNLPDMNSMRGDLTNLIAGDFNGDGRDDLIRQEKGGWVNGVRDVELYISNGTFGWANQTVLTNAFAVNGNDTLLVAGDFIAGGGKDLMRIETTNSLINGVGDIQFLSYQNGNMAVVSNTPTNIAPLALTINGVKSSYDVNSTLTIDPSYATDTNGWQDITKVDFWLTNVQGQRIELADVNSFAANGLNSAKFNYTTSLNGIAVGNYQLNAISYDKAGAASNFFARSFAIDPVYTIGFDGTTTNTAFINTFNQINGTLILGKAIGNVVSINGGKLQDFEKGSICQLGNSVFTLQGTIGNRARNEIATFGLPTSKQIATSYGAKQEFQGGLVMRVQAVIHTIHGSIWIYYRGLNTAQQNQLGAATTEEAVNGDGNWQQFFQGGSVLWKSNSTGEVKFNAANIAPQIPVINGILSSYNVNSTLSIDPSFVLDSNGWQDVTKVDFWLTNSQGQRIELADVTNFSSQDANSAKFNYTTSLNGFGAGNYNLNAVASDRAGTASNQFSKAFAIKDWFDSNLKDVGTINLVRTKAADGQLDRTDMLSILRDMEDGDVVDTFELLDLKQLVQVNNITPFSMSESIRYLSNKVAIESAVNSVTNIFEGEIGKWFLGTIAPTAAFHRDSDGRIFDFQYQNFQGSLFGTSNQARIGGIDQRGFGDCALLASLGATFSSQSNDAGNSTSQIINNMLIDNGDNTYSVRFYTQDQKAEWVTVDNRLATYQ